MFAGFVVVSYGPTLTGRYGAPLAYGAAAAFALLLLASVLLHEVGHCVVARLFDLPVRRITVTFLAGLTEIDEPPQTPAREYAVAVAGPMVSLLLGGMSAGLLPLLPPHSLLSLLALLAAISNAMVAVFNLLPGLPLDGGRLVRAAVWQLSGDRSRGTRVAAHAGRALAVLVVPALLLAGLPALGFGGPSASTIVLAALLGAFLYTGATGALRQARLTDRLPAATVARLARPALRVRGNLPLAEAVRQAQEAGVGGLVVVDSADRLEAVVNEAAVIATPEHRRPWLPVGDVARRLEDGMLLDPALAGEQLLAVLQRTPATEYVVQDPASGQVGVLAAADVVRALEPERARQGRR